MATEKASKANLRKGGENAGEKKKKIRGRYHEYNCQRIEAIKKLLEAQFGRGNRGVDV